MLSNGQFTEAEHLIKMKKSVMAVAFLLIIFIIPFALAVNETSNTTRTNTTSSSAGTTSNVNTDAVSKAYSCLSDEIDKKSSVSLQEAVFGTLALGSESKLIDEIESEKKSNENCWPKAGCTIKETAQVLLAYDRAGKSTSEIEKWLLTKNKTAGDLTWFLEVDVSNHVPSTCTITYDSTPRTIKIKDDLKLEGSGGTCLSISPSGYWLKIKTECLNKEFEISCDQDFITTLLYQKGTSGTVFVSSETHAAASLGTTSEKVSAQCFGMGNACDYEGSLWAALALDETGKDTKAFIPYLLALAPDNKKYFPETFLYILGQEDQYGEIVGSQKQNNYWETIGSPYKRFYDTSLAMLALSGGGAAELDNAKNYLLSIQTKEGCWNNNNIRDTAFILYSGWKKGASSGGGGGVIAGNSCLASGKYCVRQFSCLESGGAVLNTFDCENFRDVCCSLNAIEQTCAEKGGRVCAASEECSSNPTSSSTGSCCLTACQPIQQQSSCALFGGVCKVSCSSGETASTDTCEISGDSCCKLTPEKQSSGFGIWWIIILIILILIVILAIIFRNKIRVWWFRWRGGARTTPVTRPPSSPSIRGYQQPPRFGNPFMRQQQQQPIIRRRAVSQGDKDMEDTLRKLKEMSR